MEAKGGSRPAFRGRPDTKQMSAKPGTKRPLRSQSTSTIVQLELDPLSTPSTYEQLVSFHSLTSILRLDPIRCSERDVWTLRRKASHPAHPRASNARHKTSCLELSLPHVCAHRFLFNRSQLATHPIIPHTPRTTHNQEADPTPQISPPFSTPPVRWTEIVRNWTSKPRTGRSI